MNKYNSMTIWVLGISLFLGACNFSEKTYTKEFEELFSGIQEIEIQGRFLEVSYEGRENEEEVFLNAMIQASESSGLDIKYRKSGSKLKIEVVGDSNIKGISFGNSRRGFISLTGPENIKLTITNTSGSTEVLHVMHDQIRLKSNSGSIKVSELEVDDIQMTATSGSIRGKGLYGRVDAKVNSGQIRLEEVIGDLKAKSSSGSLRLTDVQGRVDASANSGSIRLKDVQTLGELSVSSGSIRVENSGLSEFTTLNASSGSVNIQTASDLKAFNYELVASSGRVRVGDNSGKKVSIDNDAPYTVKGKISSGSLRINN